MSLQGSIHKRSDGIGYGAFIPTDRAYYNVRTPTVSTRERRPSSEMRRQYQGQNITAGICTHRSDISFGRATESVCGGVSGDSRAREATRSLTSGEVGGFIWPADRAREGDVDTILASVSSNASLRQPEAPPTSSVMMSARSTMDHERAEEEKVAAAEMQNHQQQRPDQRGNAHDPITGRSSGSSSVLSGASTWRSDATAVLSSRSRNSPKWLSSRSSSCSGNSDKGSGDSRRRVPRATSHAKANGAVISGHVFRRSGANSTSSARENRLRPQSIRSTAADTLQERVLRQGLSSPSPSIPRLDPVFSKHHKYDLIAHTRGACGAEITGRFGPVNEDSVMAASLLTSELSTPWSHVLRGQKW